jgi:hypothetical protein
VKSLINFILIIFIHTKLLFGVDLYVATNGKDTNPGTKMKPFKSLEKARDKIRLLKAKQKFPNDGFTVWIRGGVYCRAQTFELDEQDSGCESARIIYRAYPNEDVRILGGIEIEDEHVKQAENKRILKRIIDINARSHIKQIDLRSLGINRYGKLRKYGHGLPVVPSGLEFYINEQKMQLARYPNSGDIKMGKVIDTGSVPRYGDYENIRGGIFEYTDERHSKWTDADEIWLRGAFKYGYADDFIKIKYIDPKTKRIKLTTPHMYGLGYGAPYQQYIAMNLLEELDEPGEWYLDRKTGILYFWPTDDVKNSRYAVSILEEPIIALEGASYVTISDVTLEITRGLGIYMEQGTQNRIAGCTIRNIGTTGILMGQGARQTFPHITGSDYEGVSVSRDVGSLSSHLYTNTTWDRKAGTEHGIISCDIYNTGSGGIVLGGGSKKTLARGNSFVENCLIHDYQLRNRSQWPGIKVTGCGNRVSHCEIYNGDLQAIMATGNEHVYEFNDIHDVVRNSNDASAWYMGRNPSDRGTIVRYNYFHNVGRPDRKWTMGVYFDDGICDAEVFGNVFYKVASFGSVYSNCGQDIVIRNNIFIDAHGPAMQLKSMWFDWAVKHIKIYFADEGIYRQRLLQDIDITKPPYSTRYPKLVNFMELTDDGKTYVGMYPARNIMENNLVYKHGETFRLVGEHAQFEFKNNFVTLDDPGFVDVENENFQLMDDSIVYQKIPGFEKIPFEKIGLYVDEYRTILPVE